MLIALPLVAIGGCGSSAPENEDVGVASIALTETPSDVSCIEVTATGTRQLIKRFDVTPGTSARFEMAGLPLGQVQFGASAFAEACARQAQGASPTWIGDAVVATIVKQVVAQVTLVMRRNGRVSVGVDFRDCVAGFVDLGTLDGTATINPIDMNDRGQIVGLAATPPEAFLWSGGVMRALGTGPDSSAVAINDKGQVAGTKPSQAFLWEDGVVYDIGDLGGHWSAAVAMNEVGQVAGISATATYEQRAFIWQPGSTIVDLGTLGGSYSTARAINAHGQVVGDSQTSVGESHGFLWQAGLMRDLGTLGGSSSTAMVINDAGQVAGRSTNAAGEEHVFLWEAGIMRDLGSLGGDACYPQALNEGGQLIGQGNIPGGITHAFLWEAGVMRDLGTLGGLASGPLGQRSLNESGEVVGLAETDRGEFHAFLWKAGTMNDLGTTGVPFTQAVGINDSHQIFGYTQTASNRTRGFFFDVSRCPVAETPAGGQ
jgi:probable HAF family extracellular repeat protein